MSSWSWTWARASTGTRRTDRLAALSTACATLALLLGHAVNTPPGPGPKSQISGARRREAVLRVNPPRPCRLDCGIHAADGPVTVRSPRRPRRRWHPMPNHVANPSPRLRPIKGRCISVYRLPQRRHSPSARCPTARRWHRASDRWRGCICRDRLPQGCGSRAYRDVFTACPCGYNPSSDPAPYPPRCNAGRHNCRHECRPTVPAQSA